MAPEPELEQPSAARWVAIAIIAGAIAIAATTPQLPSVTPAGADPQQFSAERARRHLEVIAREPRPVGSARHAQVRQYLIEELARLGLGVQIQAAVSAAPTEPRTVVAAAVHNVFATLGGTRGGGPAILLVAHYDSVPGSPGAGDDGAAVASILEVARAVRAGAPPANDVWLLFTDGEELGLLGARAWLAQPGMARRVGVAINAEARGSHGPSLLFETGAQAGRLTQLFGEAAPNPVGSSLYAEVYRHMPNDTDFTVFREAGIPGLNFAFIDGFPRYHSPGDDLAHADPRTLQHQGETLLALTRRLGSVDLGGLRAPDAVYFNPARSWFVHYSTVAARAGFLLACVLLAGLLVIGVRRRALRPGAIARLGGALLAAAVASAITVTGAWTALRALVPAWRAFPPQDSWASCAIALAFGAIAAAITLALARLAARGARLAELAAAATVVWLIPAAVTTFAFPGASYLFAWPFAGGVLTTGMLIRSDGTAPSLPALAIAAIPPISIVLPAVRDLYTALTLEAAAIPGASVALTAALLLPLMVGLTGRRLMLAATTLACVAVALVAFAASNVEARPAIEAPSPPKIVELPVRGSIAGVSLPPGTRVECWSTDDLPVEPSPLP